jgi:hypothetical protein
MGSWVSEGRQLWDVVEFSNWIYRWILNGIIVDDQNWQIGQTGMHKLVWLVKVTLPKFKLYFTIVYLSSRWSKCICRMPNLEFGWESYGFWKTWHRVGPVRPVQTA